MEVTERQGFRIPTRTDESTTLCDLLSSLGDTGELHGTGLLKSDRRGSEHGTAGVGALDVEPGDVLSRVVRGDIGKRAASDLLDEGGRYGVVGADRCELADTIRTSVETVEVQTLVWVWDGIYLGCGCVGW